jgi:hypothetical protein
VRYVSRHRCCRSMHSRLLDGFPARPPITALVRTAQRLSVRVRGYLPPHNFTVMPPSGKGAREQPMLTRRLTKIALIIATVVAGSLTLISGNAQAQDPRVEQ